MTPTLTPTAMGRNVPGWTGRKINATQGIPIRKHYWTKTKLYCSSYALSFILLRVKHLGHFQNADVLMLNTFAVGLAKVNIMLWEHNFRIHTRLQIITVKTRDILDNSPLDNACLNICNYFPKTMVAEYQGAITLLPQD